MSKGGTFERKLCTILSLWWTSGADDDVFWRTPGSGSRATSRKKEGKESKAPGDIQATSPISADFDKVFVCDAKKGYTGFKALSEEKIKKCLNAKNPLDAFKRAVNNNRRKGVDVLDFLDRIKGVPLLDVFYQKLLIECIEHNRMIPLLIFERDRKRSCVMISYQSYLQLFRDRSIVFPDEYIVLKYLRFIEDDSLLVKEKHLSFEGYIFNLEDFLHCVTPQQIVDLSKEATWEMPK